MFGFTSTIIAITGLFALTSAAPSARLAESLKQRDAPYVDVTFYGAADATFFLPGVPLDGYPVDFTTPFSVSSVSYSLDYVSCTVTGVDSDKAVAAEPVIANDGQVGPPQVLTSITCTAY